MIALLLLSLVVYEVIYSILTNDDPQGQFRLFCHELLLLRYFSIIYW